MWRPSIISIFLGLTILSGNASAGTMVQFHTSVGDLSVELFDIDKPVTVQNFLRYVTNGLYVDSFFHRGIGNFVIQGGGYKVRNRENPTNYNVLAVAPFPAITNEFLAGPVYSNVFGTIAMAKTSNPNSATSQFFFNLADNSTGLDDTNNSGGFTVFGRVIDGTNTLNRLNAAHPETSIAIVNAGGAFSQLPVVQTFSGPNLESDELIYVDVSLLVVVISMRPDGSREIAWTSASNRLEKVEFTTQWPAVWQTLITTNGIGGRMSVTDPSTQHSNRIYRIRVVE